MTSAPADADDRRTAPAGDGSTATAQARPGGRVVLTTWRGEAMQAAGRHLGRAVAAATDPATAVRRHYLDFLRVDASPNWTPPP
jgi:hypothetical protein